MSIDQDKVRKYVLSNFRSNGVSRMVAPYKTINGSIENDGKSIKSRLGKF